MMNTTLLMFIWFLTGVFMLISSSVLVAYESKLGDQNKADELIGFIQPSLNEGERVLAMAVGHAFGRIKVDWITDNINRFSYFIFTTDRLIIITFYPHFAGTDRITDTLATGTFERGVRNVYTCSLPDKSQVQYGAIMKHVTGAFIWTVIKACPVNQTGLYKWYLADNHTANGRMIKTIFQRLSNQRRF